MRSTVGIVLGALGVLCAVIGLLVINGISIEFPGIILGGLGYYFCLPGGSQGGSRAGQILGIVAVVLSVDLHRHKRPDRPATMRRSSEGRSLEREDEALVEQAKAILDLNWTGEYTQPGPRLYPHQWSWDSALIALAYAHYDRGRAEKELRHLFEAQWSNGLLPQIVFNPRFRDYFPGPSFWNAKRARTPPSAARPRAWCCRPSTPPPCWPSTRAPEKMPEEFLGYAFRKLEAWHEYLYRDRDPRGGGPGLHPPSLGVGDGQLPDVGFHTAADAPSGRGRSPSTSAPTPTP